MRYAIIEDGMVANVAMAEDAEFAAEQGWIACPDVVGPGWSYEGNAFAPPQAPSQAIPEAVTRRQAKLALLEAGLLHLVDDAIAALPSPQRERAQIEWAEAIEFRRDSPVVALLGAALGLTEDAIDALFVAAAAIG